MGSSETMSKEKPTEVGHLNKSERQEVKAVVWTERMMEALRSGVKGGKWFSLRDKVYSERTLALGYESVRERKGSAGIDGISADNFRSEKELSALSRELRENRYHPRAVKRVMIPKLDGGLRPLGIPAVRDRVVQSALKIVIEPIFEHEFNEHSYGFRPGRGAKDALRRVDEQLRQGYRYVVDADIRSFFDTLSHERLLQCVEERIADTSVLKLVERFLRQEVSEDGRRWCPIQGVPQGGVISPLLANIYLHELDLTLTGYEVTRYADDFVILCQTLGEAERALEVVENWMKTAKLELHPEKTRIVDMEQSEGFDFLGYRFKRHNNRILRLPRRASERRLKAQIRQHTRRTNGRSLERTIALLNPILRGWFEYFKHAHWNVHTSLDGWVRVRLRSILRKRSKRRGIALGEDNLRWPNRYFHERQLFSLATAHRALVHPST
jgi:RNA-directed DNA polymerase